MIDLFKVIVGESMARRAGWLGLGIVVLLLGFAVGTFLVETGATGATGSRRGKPAHVEGIVTTVDRRGITVEVVAGPVGSATPRATATQIRASALEPTVIPAQTQRPVLTFAITTETVIVGYNLGPDPRIRPQPRVGDRLQIDGWYTLDGKTLTARTIVHLPPGR